MCEGGNERREVHMYIKVKGGKEKDRGRQGRQVERAVVQGHGLIHIHYTALLYTIVQLLY